jgi:DNA polymerase
MSTAYPSMNPDLGRFQRPRLVLDFETYFTPDYSLRKMNVVEYVLDPRFRIHGLAVRHPDGVAYFATDVPAELAKLRAVYGQRLERVALVCHNALFDGFILDHCFGLVPATILDTAMIARCAFGLEVESSLANVANRLGLPAKGDTTKFMGDLDAGQMAALAEYAVNDVDITSQAADILLPMVPLIELWMMEHTVKVFLRRRLRLDMGLVEESIASISSAVDKALADAGIDRATAASDQKFLAVLEPALESAGVPLEHKTSKTGRRIPALAGKDDFMRRLAGHPDSRVRALVLARALVKAAPSLRKRLERMLRLGKLLAGSFPVCLRYFGAGTGRFSGSGIGVNLQNLSKPGRGSAVDDALVAVPRRALQAPDGCVLVSCDAAQIECRVLAWLAGQTDLHDDLASGIDVYCKCAASVLGREVRKPAKGDPDYDDMARARALGKAAILGLGYGMGTARFKQSLLANPDTAALVNGGTLDDVRIQGVVSWYRSHYGRVSRFWKDCEEALLQALECGSASVGQIVFNGDPETGSVSIHLPSGRVLVYEDLRVDRDFEEEWKKEITRRNPKSGRREDHDADGEDGEESASGARLGLYGAKIVENIVQAVARDLLVNAIYNAECAGLPVFLSIHDDMVVAIPPEEAEAAKAGLEEAWAGVPEWAAGLVLMAESAGPGGCMAEV